jgi:large subunit ribosomal protein L14
MILKETLLKVGDNSGARIVKCIQTIGNRVAHEGDFVIVSVRKARPFKKVQKGKVYRALVIQCKKPVVRSMGHVVFFRSNRVVLLKKPEGKKIDVSPIGTRISKFVSFFVRKKGFSKILLLSPGYV